MDKPAGASSYRDYEAIPRYLPWVTGRFYTFPDGTTITTTTPSASIPTAIPIYVPNTAGVTVTAIGINVTSGIAASLVRLAIYKAQPSGIPGNLLLDAGTVATTSIAFASITISQFLRQGWYYLAGAFDHTPTINTYSAFLPRHHGGFDSPDTTAFLQMYSAFGASAATADVVTNGFPGSWPLYTSQTVPNPTSVFRYMVGI